MKMTAAEVMKKFPRPAGGEKMVEGWRGLVRDHHRHGRTVGDGGVIFGPFVGGARSWFLGEERRGGL